MRKISFLIVVIFLSGCSEDLIEIANKNRLIPYPPIYDCRDSVTHIGNDSSVEKTTVFTYLIDIKNKRKLFVRSDINSEIDFSDNKANLLLRSIMPPVLGEIQFKEINYDLTDISETNNFIRFTSIDIEGNKEKYVIDLNKKQLVYKDDLSRLPKEWNEMAKSYGIQSVFDNSFVYDCKIK